jgi:hypothetical protein
MSSQKSFQELTLVVWFSTLRFAFVQQELIQRSPLFRADRRQIDHRVAYVVRALG